MKKHIRIQLSLLAMVLATALSAFADETKPAEDKAAAHARVLQQRAEKIVAALGIDDAAKGTRVRDIIVGQYRSLGEIHDARDARIAAAKKEAGASKETTDAAVQSARDEAKAKLDKLHADYLKRLSADLTPEQVDKVKDGMTYGVVQVTYNVYLKMMPDLTDAQKKQIMAWLVEARELAMDEGTSEEKHKVFGKFKGRINNYLSAAGYDLKKAEENLKKK